MSKLLYVESSPRKSRSKSIAVAYAFVEAYKTANPNDEVVTVDLWDKTLPEFDGYTIDAKYQVLHGQNFDAQQHAAWQAVVNVCNEFKAADKYLFSLPMWNFGIPYKLKHYIDVLVQPGETFKFDPEQGYRGLVQGKPIAVVYARGGSYSNSEAKGMDHQKSYMDLLLGFIGFANIQSILVEPTMAAPDELTKTEVSAIQLAQSVARVF